MSLAGARVCLVSPGSLASNPRLVKEADALHAAGAEVHVVASGVVGFVRPLDETILERAPWAGRVRLVEEPPGPAAAARKALERTARLATRVVDPGRSLWLSVQRHNRMAGLLRRAARGIRADLFIAHYLAALPAAAEAADACGGLLGFDAEDLHHGELLPDSAEARAELAARERIQAHFLPRCRHLTGASPMISRAYSRRYGVSMATVLNVFPRWEPPVPRRAPAPGGAVRFYWFSQTIGPGRGLEEFLGLLNASGARAKLALRGFLRDGYGPALQASAGSVELDFLDPAPPDRMISLAAEHDVGLCLEQSEPPHRDACLTNKMFACIQAGLPVVLSPTAAHREFAPRLGKAALLLEGDRAGDARRLAAWLDSGIGDAAREADRLARDEFHWERESGKFLARVQAALDRGRAPEADPIAKACPPA